jgi:leucyl aminopeptidase
MRSPATPFRPGDVLKSRKGLSVEIGNTDAEGRLILGDALAKAAEGTPELILDFATLTGAARSPSGPDLPPSSPTTTALADDLLKGGEVVSDPLWRMPLWKPMTNSSRPTSPTSAMLRHADGRRRHGRLFPPEVRARGLPWAHFDTFAWRSAPKPAVPRAATPWASGQHGDAEGPVRQVGGCPCIRVEITWR